MRTTLGICRVAALLSVALITSGRANAQKLTLDESVKIALENNPTVTMAKENLKKANALIIQATAPGMPKVSLTGNYQRLDKVTTATLGPNTVKLGSLQNRSADLVVDQFVDVFGMTGVARKTARAGRSAYQRGVDMAVNDVTLEAKSAYFNVLRAYSFLKVQEDTIAQLDGHLKDTMQRKQAGDATQFEVLRAETAVANAKQGLLAARNAVRISSSAFNNVLVRPLETPVELADPAPPVYYTLDMQKCVDAAAKNRPELQQADLMVKVDDGLAKVASLNGMPKVSFRWDLNKNFDTSLFNPRENSWTAFVTASFNVFDGGAVRATANIAKSEANNARSTREKAFQGVSLEAQQAYLDVTNNQERVQAAEKALEMATESMRLAEVRYKGGVSTQVENLDAQAAFTQAAENHVTALYDYQESLATLERAVGGREQFMALVGAK